jgi:hypothetical protein
MPQLDRRETILARLEAIVSGIGGLETAGRNIVITSDTALPAIVVHDGKETADEADPRSRPSSAPRRIALIPEITIKAADTPEAIGATLGALRLTLLPLIINDSALAAVVGDSQNFGIRYLGCITEFSSDRQIIGTMRISIELAYPFLLKELTG